MSSSSSSVWQYLIIQNESGARRDAACRLATLLAGQGNGISATGEQVDSLADFAGLDRDGLSAALQDLHTAGWLAPLEWGPGGELRTALTLPEGVAS